MAAARKKIPPAVNRWLAKLKPDELLELEQLAARRRQMLERAQSRPPIEVLIEGVVTDHADMIDALGPKQ